VRQRWAFLTWFCVSAGVACGGTTETAVATSADPTPARRVVDVDGGQIAGLAPAAGDEVWIYKGIPFAAPPVGDRRWRPPQSVVPWSGVKDATNAAPACMQTRRPDNSF
jgi:para-nitrobenzyl esterase